MAFQITFLFSSFSSSPLVLTFFGQIVKESVYPVWNQTFYYRAGEAKIDLLFTVITASFPVFPFLL